uniref:IRS-type PTB domain-containing protein n=1 Tax=Macrostomum lignano TaxID=282301 RepID=A0A1I8J6H5_9PLAT
VGVNITAKEISDAWQSSAFRQGCFRDSSARPWQWDYFHSSNTPDASGYQWLLVKLARCVSVRSVIVHRRNVDKVRAQGIEVLLGHQMPAGLTESPLDCIASFNHSLTEFYLCGVTGNFGNSNFSYKMTCATRNYSKLPRFVLLRKFVANAADKYMNFVMVELEEDEQDEAQESGCFREYFCKPEGRKRCSVEQLSKLTQSDKVMVKESLPCKTEKPDSVNCSIRTRSGDVIPLRIKTYRPSFLILNDTTVTWELHGASLQCRHSCTDGTLAVTSQTLGLRGWKSIKIPSSIQLNLGFTKYWVVNSTAVFTFITQGSFPMPVHKCSVAISVSSSNDSIKQLNLTSEDSVSASTRLQLDRRSDCQSDSRLISRELGDNQS